MNDFKERCIDLRRSGHTLNEIVKITNRSKSSVYAHIANIPLNENRKKEIKIETCERAKKIALSRRGVSLKPFKEFKLFDNRNVLLLSHLMFDGSITRTSCVYNNRNLVLVRRVEDLMRDVYSYEPKKYLNKETKVFRISFHNVSLANYLEKKNVLLLRKIASLSKELKLAFLKAFFDDEGCIDFRPSTHRRQIRGYQKNVTILNLVKKLLIDFSIESKVVKPNEIVISGKCNFEKFRKEISFSKGVTINGARPNSRWKKSIEKRILLDKAIDSFEN